MMELCHYAQFAFVHPTRDPEEVTAAVGVSPTTVGRVGDVVLTLDNGEVIRAHQNAWVLQPDVDDVWLALTEILALLEPRWSSVVEMCKTWQPTIICAVRWQGDDEDINLSPEMLSRFAALGTGVQIRVSTFD